MEKRDAEGNLIEGKPALTEAEAAALIFEAQFDEMNQKVLAAKKELDTERLKRAEEHIQYEQRMSLLAAERTHFQEEKIKIEEAAKRVNQQGYGQEKLIEIEVARRIEQALK